MPRKERGHPSGGVDEVIGWQRHSGYGRQADLGGAVTKSVTHIGGGGGEDGGLWVEWGLTNHLKQLILKLFLP